MNGHGYGIPEPSLRTDQPPLRSARTAPPQRTDVRVLTDEEFILKNDLLARLSEGEITTDAAEAEAANLGIGPLEYAPDPALHDPMEKPHWSFPMTLAWIIWRNGDDVREWD